MSFVLHGAQSVTFGHQAVTFGPAIASLVPLVITYIDNASLTIEVPSYALRDVTEQRAIGTRSGRRGRPHRTRTTGDTLPNPSTLDVTAHVNEGSFAASITEAYAVVNAAERSTSVSTHRGTVTVRGILASELHANALGIDVRLSFRVVRPYTPPIS